MIRFSSLFCTFRFNVACCGTDSSSDVKRGPTFNQRYIHSIDRSAPWATPAITTPPRSNSRSTKHCKHSANISTPDCGVISRKRGLLAALGSSWHWPGISIHWTEEFVDMYLVHYTCNLVNKISKSKVGVWKGLWIYCEWIWRFRFVILRRMECFLFVEIFSGEDVLVKWPV